MEAATPSQGRQPTRSDAKKIDDILKSVQVARWTLGDFLHHLLDPDADLGGKTPNRHGSMLKSFMTGMSTKRAIHVVQSLYQHPLGQPKNRNSTDYGNHFSLDVPLSDIKYCRPAMSSWALQAVLEETDAEARWLCGKNSGLRVRATGQRRDEESTAARLESTEEGSNAANEDEVDEAEAAGGATSTTATSAIISYEGLATLFGDGRGSHDVGEDGSSRTMDDRADVNEVRPEHDDNSNSGHENAPVQNGSQAERRKRTHTITDPLVTWPIINSVSVPGLVEKYKRKAPVTWGILYNFVTSKSDEVRGEDTGEYRPRDLVCMSVVSELVYKRNPWTNLFPLCRGLCMFGTKAHQASYRIGSRLAQNSPYSTVRSALKTMSAQTRKELREMCTGANPTKVIVVLDNVQIYSRRRDNRIGSGNRMVIGTGATAVIMEDCSLDAFELQPILDKMDEGVRGKLTAKDITTRIDSEHTEKVRMFHWVQTLVSYVPELATYRKDVSNIFQTNTRKHQINPHRKTTVQPLGTNSANEVTTRGMKEAVTDFLGQLGLNKETIGSHLQFVSGDGKSFDGMHQVKKICSGAIDNYRAMRFLRPVLELWHTKWTQLSAIVRGHWGGKHSTSDPSSLGFLAKIINSPTPSDFSKVDFYPNTRLISVAVQAHMLDCWAMHFNATNGLLDHFKQLSNEGRLPALSVLTQDAALLSRQYSSEKAYIKALRAPGMNPDLYDVPIGTRWMPGHSAPMEPEHESDDPMPDEAETDFLGPAGTSNTSRMQNESLQNDTREDDADDSSVRFRGDWALANSILLMRDGIWYLEVVQAVAIGDIGRVWEVLKIWIFTFAGAGNTNYTAYLLEMFCNIELEYPKATRDALFNNWLVNQEGKPGHFLEMDLMQEHFNFWLEVLAQYKGKEFDDPWYRETLSMHVHQLIRLVQEFEKNVQLAARRKAHSAPHMDNELNSAIEHCHSNKLHVHREGRDYGFHAADHFSAGYHKLVDEGKLDRFIAKGMEEYHNKNTQIDIAQGHVDATTYLPAPVSYEDGRVLMPTSADL